MMTPEAIQQAWDNYSKTWTDLAPSEREHLVRETLAEDVIYSSPDAEGRCTENFIPVLEDFQQRFPGAYFQTEELIVQHRQSLAIWTMRDRDDAPLLSGHTYARYNDRGLIEHVAGFWLR